MEQQGLVVVIRGREVVDDLDAPQAGQDRAEPGARGIRADVGFGPALVVHQCTFCPGRRIPRHAARQSVDVGRCEIVDQLGQQDQVIPALRLTSTPRSCSRSSTFRSDSGNRTYSITARRMISELVLKYLKGLRFVIHGRYAALSHASTQVPLTVPSATICHRSRVV